MKARYRRALAVWREAQELVTCLDKLNGEPSDVGGSANEQSSESAEPCRVRFSSAPPHTRRGWSLLLAAAQDLSSARRLSLREARTGEELWSLLRKSLADCYGRTPGKDVYRPFVPKNIAELEEGSPVVIALDVLPGQIAEVLAHEANVIRILTEGEGEVFQDLQRRYAHVGGEEEEWYEYHDRVDVDGYWMYGLEEWCKAFAAVLAVGRAKDARLRKLIACCPVNFLTIALLLLFPNLAHWTDMGMPGGALLCRAHTKNDIVGWAGGDLSQAFTSVETMRWLWFYMACPGLPPHRVPQHHREASWGPRKKIIPFYKRLPMGFALSVFMLMAIVTRASQEALALNPIVSNFKIMNSRKNRFEDGDFDLKIGVIVLHVDDVISGHEDQRLADIAVMVILERLIYYGFVGTMMLEGKLKKMLGYAKDERGPFLRIPKVRMGHLLRAIEMQRNAPAVSPKAVHTVVSIFIWGALLWRPALAALSSVFKFIEVFEENPVEQVVNMWDSMKVEYDFMKLMLGFCRADLGQRLLPVLLCQDAAGGEDSLCESYTGGFAMALAFPPDGMLQMLKHRH